MILARLLPPSAYGLLGMAMIVIGFLQIFKDIGTASALIQRKELDDRLISSVFWLNIIVGVVMMAVAIACAPLAANFFGEPQLTLVMSVLALSFLFSSLSIVHQSLLMRQMAFQKLTYAEVPAVILSTTAGIAMALGGAGVWSLVTTSLANAAVLTVLLWFTSSWRPSWYLSWQDIRSIASYSLNLSGFHILNYFVRNADNLLVGRYLGATALGFYAMAYNIMLYPLQSIASVLGRVLFPAFSQLQDDHARFRQAYLRLCATISALTFPMMLGVMVTADLAIGILMGANWLPVATLLIILAPVGMLQSVVTTLGHIYTAKGRTDWQFRWGIVKAILFVSAFALGLRWGIYGVATTYAVVFLLLLYPNFVIPFRLIELPVHRVAQAVWPPLKYGLMMAAVVMLVRFSGAWLGASDVLLLVASILTGVLTYSTLMVLNRPPVVYDFVSLLSLQRVPVLQRMVLRLRLIK
jgi:PST family polysaccharide transporter